MSSASSGLPSTRRRRESRIASAPGASLSLAAPSGEAGYAFAHKHPAFGNSLSPFRVVEAEKPEQRIGEFGAADERAFTLASLQQPLGHERIERLAHRAERQPMRFRERLFGGNRVARLPDAGGDLRRHGVAQLLIARQPYVGNRV